MKEIPIKGKKKRWWLLRERDKKTHWSSLAKRRHEQKKKKGFIDIFIIMNTTYQFKRGHRLCWHGSWEEKKMGAMCTMVCAGSVTLSIRLDSAYQRPAFFFFFFSLKCISLALGTVQWVSCTVHGTHKPLFSTKFSLKWVLRHYSHI